MVKSISPKFHLSFSFFLFNFSLAILGSATNAVLLHWLPVLRAVIPLLPVLRADQTARRLLGAGIIRLHSRYLYEFRYPIHKQRFPSESYILFIYIYICFFCVPSCCRRCPLLATLIRFLLSAFRAFFFSNRNRVPGLIWFGPVYLMTTAGFVADQ